MKQEKTFIKTEAETKINRKGEPGEWQNLPDERPEYWSEASLKKRSLKEQYLKIEAESDEAYTERLRRIGEYAIKDSILEIPPKPGKYYTYEDYHDKSMNDSISGYKFDEYISPTSREDYDKTFAEIQKAQGIKDTIADEIRAREDGVFAFTVAPSKDYEKQKDFARHYIGSLYYRDQAEVKGLFQDVAPERYSPDHADYVYDKRAKFLEYDQNDEDKIEDKIDGKILEGTFYALIGRGFFDSSDGQAPAANILTSDYDDFYHKVDVAAFIPLSEGADYCPISFDLTIGHGNKKIANIRKKFEKTHGLANIEYPSTCYDRELAPLSDVPHFIVCLPRDSGEFASFNASLAGGNLPTKDIRDLINYQIYTQANHWAIYWKGKPGREDIQKKFEQLTDNFMERLSLDKKNTSLIDKIGSIQHRHREAIRFLHEASLI